MMDLRWAAWLIALWPLYTARDFHLSFGTICQNKSFIRAAPFAKISQRTWKPMHYLFRSTYGSCVHALGYVSAHA